MTATRVSPARLSVVVPMAFPDLTDAELPEVARRLAGDYGFDAIEFPTPADPSCVEPIAAALLSTGLDSTVVCGIPLHRLGIGLTNVGEAGAKARDIVRESITTAGRLGSSAVMVTLGPNVTEPERPTAIERSVTTLVQLAGEARAAGLRFLVEPSDTELDRRQLLGSTALGVQIAQAVERHGERVELLLDQAHLIQLGEDLDEALARAAPYCRRFHLANTAVADGHPLRGDTHPPFGHPGSEVNQAAVHAAIDSLRTAGYLRDDVVVSLEVRPLEGDDPWAVLSETVRVVEL